MSRIKHLLAAAAISIPLYSLAQAAAVPPIVSAASLGKTAMVTSLIAAAASRCLMRDMGRDLGRGLRKGQRKTRDR